MSVLLSMSAFALAASISPGPVNLVALSAGARHGFLPSLRHVAGASLGFTLLLLLVGNGLHGLLLRWPLLNTLLLYAGVLFLLHMAWKLASSDGALEADAQARLPSFANGALMQWLNPKAWMAAGAGMGLFAVAQTPGRLWQFAALYLVICFASVACWAWAGSRLRRHLRSPRHVRLLNRSMAVLLLGCAAALLVP